MSNRDSLVSEADVAVAGRLGLWPARQQYDNFCSSSPGTGPTVASKRGIETSNGQTACKCCALASVVHIDLSMDVDLMNTVEILMLQL